MKLKRSAQLTLVGLVGIAKCCNDGEQRLFPFLKDSQKITCLLCCGFCRIATAYGRKPRRAIIIIF